MFMFGLGFIFFLLLMCPNGGAGYMIISFFLGCLICTVVALFIIKLTTAA